MIVQPDGMILVAGNFTTIGGQARNSIARLDSVTGLADSFDPNANSYLSSIALQADNKILVGGNFTAIGGQIRAHIARLNAKTGLADSFNPQANFGVHTIALQADGKILVGGGFTNIGGQARQSMARLDAATGLADSFNPSANNFVSSIAVQADGKILAGGYFSGANSIGGATRNRIARLDPTTGLADSFDPNADSIVLALALQADGKVLTGGIFTSVGGQGRRAFARLSNNTAGLQELMVTPTAITWTRAGSSPQLARVTFEDSSDGTNFHFLGNGTASGSEWTVTGLNLPPQQNIYIRARGFYRSGAENGSDGITESVRNVFLTATPLQVAAAVSRKIHGSAGAFDIPLPLTGNPGVECRSSGGAHTLVVTFSNNVVSGNASVTTGIGTISGGPSFSGNTMIVNLAGVADVQGITVALSNVTDSSNQVLPDTAVSMNVLAGDTNGNKVVTGTDVGQTKAQASLPVTSANFRQDVTVNGTINASDVGLVKARAGQFVP